ncbi:MAG: beta-lactamase family protein [Deltaproteobacteria bacterium]|nr:beta-lactamase family protein [Deltaproteobacteria bacterium]
MKTKRLLWIAILALSFSTPTRADDIGPRIGPSDPAELEAFVDGLLPGLMKTHHAPGAVFVMVKDGRVFFSKGYGHADIETRRPIDPETTLFRVASVSKLITAIAALQQVEQGKLDLHADVNTYLDGFQLESNYPDPVTLHHLLTHTAGFDDRFAKSSRRTGAALPPLGDYLAERMPPRVMPPGKLLSYSNHGLALVGHLVEQASGTEFTEYVDAHVLGPLGMANSRFFLDVPLSPDLATPYRIQDGRVVPFGYDHTLLGPAAELNTTGTDMARFMIAQLQLGRLGDARVLSENTARLMQETHFRHHPELDGWCYGFVETRERGVRRISHGGSWRGFRTFLTLVPEADMGIFISVNVELQQPLFRTFMKTFVEHYYPGQAPVGPEANAVALEPYSGVYIPNRRMRGSFLKLGTLLGLASVAPDDDGVLTIRTAALGAMRVLPAGEDHFRERDGEMDVAFLRGDDGRVAYMAAENFAYDRVSFLRSPAAHVIVAVVCAVLFVGTLLGWTLGALVRLFASGPASAVSRTARLVGAFTAGLWTVAVVGTALNLSAGNLFEFLYEDLPTNFRVLLFLPVVAVLPSLALPWFAVRGVAARAPLARLHYVTLALAAIAMLALAHHWNLLGAF